MNKKEKYKRDRILLLNDFYELLKVQDISPNFKFNNLRNDLLHSWTSPDGDVKISKKFWSKNAFQLFKPRYDAGISDERELLKGIQLDHIVPRVWFEEMLMPIIIDNKNTKGFEIPEYALAFLLDRLALGALVTKDENQKEIDGIKEEIFVKKRKGIHKGNIITEERWKKKPTIFGMPLNFYNQNHEQFLNPWARYIEANLDVIIVNWSNNKINTDKLNFHHYKFDINNLTDYELKGFKYWTNEIEKIYHSNKKN